jgi:gliding motility-associated-like protein
MSNAMKKYFVISLFFLLISLYSFSQTYLISTGGTVTTCLGDFFDSGDIGGSYGNNENFVMTFHSTGPPNTHVLMVWNSFDVDPGDTLYIYDGSSVASPLLGAYNNNNLPGAFTHASVFNLSGDLTFKFKSNASIVAAGWYGDVTCTHVCQMVIACIDTVECFPAPNDSNYIDICIGNIIHFAAGGGPETFPQNNNLYHQDSTTTLYEWDFGDGSTATGRVVDHLYTVVRGYDVTLQVTDTMGCYNANALGLRVRISANPYAEVHALPDMCSNTDTTFITLGYSLSSSITIAPITSHQQASQKFDSVMFIPDGPNCAPGYYDTYVTFNDFAPGQLITSSADVLSVIVSIEHSWAGDLGFTLFCPNGQNVVLDGNDMTGSNIFLGVPNETDNSPACSPASNPPGTPWIYGWSQIYPTQGSLNVLDAGPNSTIPAADTINHTNYFIPDQSFSNLIGCPLNGQWDIRITDDWGSDNGYIFMWELNLDPSLLPTGWGYSVPIDTVMWTGSFFTIIDDTTIMVIPDSSGTFYYTVTVVDAFGCTYDTNLAIQVVQTPHVNLGNDTIICGNNVVYYLDAGPGNFFQWSTMAHTDSVAVTSTGIYAVTVENYNQAGTLTCSDTDAIFVKVLALPAVDLGHDTCIKEPMILDATNLGPFHYIWNNGDTTSSIIAGSTGLYSVTAAEEFGYNCESSDDIHVTVFPVPVISLGPDSTICRHHTIKIEVTDVDGFLNSYPYTYSWSPFPGLNPNDPFVTLSWLDPNQTYDIVCNVTGCEVYSATMKLTVNPCDLQIPNIITPNSDGFNDKFRIPNMEYYPNSTLVIYNRWGRKVYENTNYNNEWDGGKDADGVYYWILTINYGNHGNGLETKQQSGTVTVMR